MNMFYRRSISEYQRQIGLKESFAIQTERLHSIIESINQTQDKEPPTDRRDLRRCFRLLLLSPLVEVAWADGRVTRRESDAILKVADVYGLTDDETGYCELLGRLTVRPVPRTVGRMWQDFHDFFENLSEGDRSNIEFCLNVQAQFIAEQSSDNLVSFLQGERVSESEREALQIVAEQLQNARAAAQQAFADKQPAVALPVEIKVNEITENAAISAELTGEIGDQPTTATIEDYEVLVPLVPLVKTAWAEGRVTKRERHLVFEAAARMGIKPETTAHRRLADWLELHPTEEFYGETLERLKADLQKMPEEERMLRRLDLLSDCVNIAEASGGTKNYPSGGVRVCDEEIAAVKYIAQKLSPTAPTTIAH